MNGTENTPSSTGQNPVACVQTTLVITLALTLLIGLSLLMFLYGQRRTAVTDLKNVQPQLAEAQAFISDFKTNIEPRMKSLQDSLLRYSATHPDLVPLLQRYGIGTKPAATGPAPAGVVPATAPAGAAPKR